MKLLSKFLVLAAALVMPLGLFASDLTGVELILPAGFQFILPDPSITVDGSGSQLAARAPGGVTLNISHHPDRKFLPGDIAKFFEDGKKTMAGQSMITMRSTAIVEKSGRTWGLAVIDSKMQKKELVQFQLVTSLQDTLLIFEFQGPKKREKFVESAARDFMISNPFRILAEPGSQPKAAGAPKNP